MERVRRHKAEQDAVLCCRLNAILTGEYAQFSVEVELVES